MHFCLGRNEIFIILATWLITEVISFFVIPISLSLILFKLLQYVLTFYPSKFCYECVLSYKAEWGQLSCLRMNTLREKIAGKIIVHIY